MEEELPATLMEPVVEQIVKQCADRGIQVSLSLATFVMHAVIMENSEHLQVERELKKDYTKTVSLTVEKLTESNSAPLETLRLQVAYENTIFEEDAKIRKQAKDDKQAEDRVREAVMTHRALNPSALEALFGNLVSFVITRSKLGDADSRTDRREVGPLVEKVSPPRNLPDFVTGNDHDKEQHILELTDIVTGMRVFQRESGPTPASTARSAVSATSLASVSANASSSLSSMAAAAVFVDVTTLMDQAIAFEDQLTKQLQEDEGLPPQFVSVVTAGLNAQLRWTPKPGVARLTQELAYTWQRILYLRDLLADISAIRARIADLSVLYNARVTELREGSVSAQSYQLFPLYMSLSSIFYQLRKEQVQLDVRTRINAAVVSLRSPSYESLLRPEDIQEAQRLLETPQAIPRGDHKFGKPSTDVTAIAPEDFEAYAIKNPAANSSFALKGFCPWALVERGGLLVQRNRDVAVAAYKGKLYGFSSQLALQAFSELPSHYLRDVITMARRRPEFVFLLDLQDSFPEFSSVCRRNTPNAVEAAVAVGPKRVPASDAEAQTDANPMRNEQGEAIRAAAESSDMRGYHWNEWELRRRALALVELRNKRTVSTQTDISHFRRENTTQYWQPKSVGTQTGVSVATNTPVVKRYYTGLRGADDRVPRIIDVSYDLTEGPAKPLLAPHKLPGI